METLYFTLGIASVVVTAVAVGAIWVMFKVAKINSKLQDVEQQFGSTHRDITMVEQTIMNDIDNKQRDLDHRIADIIAMTDQLSNETNKRTEELHREQNDRLDELNRYIDSRVDRLAARAKKEFVNG